MSSATTGSGRGSRISRKLTNAVLKNSITPQSGFAFGRPEPVWTRAYLAGRTRLSSYVATHNAMKKFLGLIFTWWNRRPLNTQLWTWLYGEMVGEDEFGNLYYRRKGGKIDPALGFERRWVIYNGYAEASTIPPSWHGWMHHTVDTPPTEEITSRVPGRSRTDRT